MELLGAAVSHSSGKVIPRVADIVGHLGSRGLVPLHHGERTMLLATATYWISVSRSTYRSHYGLVIANIV